MTSEILAIDYNDARYAVAVMAGNRIVNIITTEAETRELQIGAEVTL